MTEQSSIKPTGSLVERAAELYDFNSAIRAPVIPDKPKRAKPAAVAPAVREVQEAKPEKKRRAKTEEPAPPPQPVPAEAAAPVLEPQPQPARARNRERLPSGRYGEIDRESLREAGFILPDAPVSGLAEELRIIKRQLLLGVAGHNGIPEDKRQTILVCSARSDEGKTFTAVNLALSLASEKDVEVLLVDGDFVKPEILSILGLEGGPGFIDAIADSTINVENYVIQTDVEGLSVLPAGRAENAVTELLASERTREVLADLTRRRPRRIVIFDSPPALMASPASVLATHVGQVLMVVRADSTTEAELREAVALLGGCPKINLVLNGAGAAATGRRFGSYYGYGE